MHTGADGCIIGKNIAYCGGTMATEFELKYTADEKIHRLLEAAYGPWEEISMETAYFDTPEDSLSARHITLRRRLENGISVCTLKTPTGGLQRGEWELECDSIQEAIPVLCKQSGWDLLPLLKKGVAQICGAKFLRKSCTLTLEQCTVEIALDSGKLTGGGRECPLGEVEIELKSGSEAAAVAFAGALAEKYSLQQEYKSKFRRALALAKGEYHG